MSLILFEIIILLLIGCIRDFLDFDEKGRPVHCNKYIDVIVPKSTGHVCSVLSNSIYYFSSSYWRGLINMVVISSTKSNPVVINGSCMLQVAGNSFFELNDLTLLCNRKVIKYILKGSGILLFCNKMSRNELIWQKYAFRSGRKYIRSIGLGPYSILFR